MKLPTISLSLIMKNEAHVLKRLLNSVYPILDYYSVVDTGSTDNSKEIVKDFFLEKGIPGEIHDHPFLDFSDARNFALESLKGKADFAFMIDCDEELSIDNSFNLEKVKEHLSKFDSALSLVHYNSSRYGRRNFFRTDKTFKWIGKVHEYLSSSNNETCTTLEGLTTIVHSDGASWANQKEKYLGHAAIFEKEVAEKNDPRDVFYLAQSYKDAGENAKAIEWYKKRASMEEGFYEERYVSQLNVGRLMANTGEKYDKVICEWLKCSMLDILKADHLFHIIDELQNQHQWEASYIFSLYAMRFHNKNPYPNRTLFLDGTVYERRLLNLHIKNCEVTGRKAEVEKIMEIISPPKSDFEKYLDLLKLSLMGVLTEDQNTKFLGNGLSKEEVTEALSIKHKLSPTQLNGLGWAYEISNSGLTMIGYNRLENIQRCAIDVFKNKIEGDFIETGVWRGGACVFMARLLKEFKENRNVYVCDSFEGLPVPEEKYPADKGDRHHTFEYLKIGVEQVKQGFEKYKVLDDNIKFVKGWFKDTIPTLAIDKISILRLDGDMYSSTWEVLECLYDKVSMNGYVIVDDYALGGCRKAIEDFRKLHNINDTIINIDGMGVYWKKVTSISKVQGPPTEVDVCILSNAKTDELKKVTEEGIRTLIASEANIKFNVYVVEGNENVKYDFPNTTTLHTWKEFNYNGYLNFAIQHCKSDYIALCNNDLIYTHSWATNIINEMKSNPELLSASPFCPGVNVANGRNVHFGYNVRKEVNGWCLFTHKNLFKKINKIDEGVSFWFSDNIFSDQLQFHGVKHALIQNSIVLHHENNLGVSGEVLLDDSKKYEYTSGQHQNYLKARSKYIKQ